MIAYILKRFIYLVPLLIGITLISFFIIHLAPGKPGAMQDFNPKVSLEVRERLAHLYGLDKPLYIQYFDWVKRIVVFDFGRSFVDDRKVQDKIFERLPITILIELLSLILILLVSIPIGVISAVRKDSIFDKVSTVIVFIGFAVPTFWLGLIMMLVFGVKLDLLPVSGIVSLQFDEFTLVEKIVDILKHLVMPVFILSFTSLAGMSRYMRGNMLEIIHQDYIRTARAKGLSERLVIYKHALKNALLPVVTILGLSIPGLIGGSVITETIFAIPGMGRLFFDSVMSRDYPTVMGLLVIGAVLTLLGNFIADISYSYVDPRIRLKER